MKKLFVAVMATMMLFVSQGQQLVRGVVVDEISKEPLAGATIQNTDTGNGAVVDRSGRFSVPAELGATLEVRFVGYNKQMVQVDSDLMYISMKPNYELEQLVIKGVRAKADDPVAKTTVSKEFIKKEYVGEHPIFLIERLSPSIFSYSESGSTVANYGQIRLRGIGQERINFTLNGVPLNDMIDHGVFFSNFTDITSSFESIQVQRGIGTSSTGAASYAGSINMESFNVSNSEAFSQVQLGAGSFNTYRTNFAVNTGINENNMGFYSSFSRLWSDGYKDNTFSDASSFFMTGGYYGDKNLVRITAFNGRSENGLGYYTVDKSILDNDPTFNNLSENDRDDFSQYMVQLQYTRKFSDKLSLSNTAYYGGAGGDFAEGTPDVDSIYVENYFSPYQTTFFSINYPLKNDHYGLISNLFYQGGKFEFSAGIHGYIFNRENREALQPDNSNPYYEDQTTKRELALFAKGAYGLSEKLSVFGDIQLRSMKIEFFPDYSFIFGDDLNRIDLAPIDPSSFTFLNPRVGFKYDVGYGTSAFLSYGRSGREPTRVDLIGGFQLNGNSLDVLNTNSFDPEFVNDLEAGINISKPRIALGANIFYMNFNNEIAPLGEVIAFGVQRRVNIEDSYRVGFESDWNYLLTSNFSFSGNLTLMQSQISKLDLGGIEVSEVEQILTPNVISRAGLSWSTNDNRLGAGVFVNYMSKSFMEYTNDPSLTVPSFATVDMALNYQPNQKFNFQLQVRNLTDAVYYTYGTPTDIDFSGTVEPGFFAQPPRNFFLTTNFRF